jgi:hypothetical protein
MRKISLAVMMILIISVMSVEGRPKMKRRMGLRGIGARLSYVNPEDLDGTFGLGAHADFGDFLPSLAFYPSITYWRSSLDVPGFDVSFTEIALNSDVHYYIPSHGNISPYLGGGLGIIFSSLEDVDSDTDLGINFLGGLETYLSPKMKGFMQTRVKFDGLDTFKLTAGFTARVGGPKRPVTTIRKGKKDRKPRKR